MRLAAVGCLVACSFQHGRASEPQDASSDGATDAARDGTSNVSLVIEAETPSSTISADGQHTWMVATAKTGFSGTGYITLVPNDFVHCLDINSATCGAYNRYNVTIPVTGMYRVTIRHHSEQAGADDSVFWYAGTQGFSEDLDPDPVTVWTDDSTTTVVMLAAGALQFALRSRETGTDIDYIRLDLQ